MPQRGAKASLAVLPRGGWLLRKRNIALASHVLPAQDRSRVVYVVPVRERNTDSGDWATLIKAGRLSARLSQLAFAKAVGVSRETVWRWETGRQKPENAEAVDRVAKVTRQDYDQLMRAAGLALAEVETLPPKVDPRLRGLDPNDNVVKTILALNISDERKIRMLDRRRKILAERERADLEEIEFLIDPGSDAV